MIATVTRVVPPYRRDMNQRVDYVKRKFAGLNDDNPIRRQEAIDELFSLLDDIMTRLAALESGAPETSA